MHALPSNPSLTSNVTATLGFVAVAGVASAVSVALAVAIVMAIAAVAALVDVREARIPNRFPLLALVPSAVTVLVGDARPGDVAMGLALFTLPLLAIHVLSPHSMGFGDVKLAVPLGASLGAVDPVLSLLALCVASATTAAVGLASRRDELPFAPGLVGGSIAALVLSTVFSTDWLLPWR